MDRDDALRALELAGVGTFRWRADGHLTCDPRCLGLFATSGAPGRIDALLEWVAPEDRAEVARALTRVVETRDDATIDFRTREARTLRARLRATEDGGFGVVVDVSPEAETQTRLATQRNLIAVIGHDLRSPLQVITTAASILPELSELTAPQLKTTNRIRASVDQATQLVQDLVDFVQGADDATLAVDRSRVDLAALVREVVQETKAVEGTFEVAIDAEVDLIGRWDRERVAQMISNLVLHAYAYAPDGGTIEVAASGTNEGVALTVRFGGDPIPQGGLARLFEPFESRRRVTRKPVAKSLGLGLYWVDVVARAHGGRASVASSAADGTTLRVELPRAEKN